MPKQDESAPSEVQLKEMLKRLKEPERAEGELITREDGTQVIRQKRKKRRSSQPKKEAREKAKRVLKQRLIITGVTAFLLLVALGALLVHYNSKSYRIGLQKDLSERVGADAAIEVLSVKPFELSAEKLSFRASGDSLIDRAEFNLIEAPLHPLWFLTGKTQGDSINASSGTVRLRLPGFGNRLTSGEASDTSSRFGDFQSQNTELLFGESSEVYPRLTGVNLLLLSKAKELEIRLRNGELEAPDIGSFPVVGGILTVQEKRLELSGFRLGTLSGSGQVSLSGSLRVEADQVNTLEADIDRVAPSDLFGQDFGRLFSGQISADAALVEFSPLNDGAEIEVRGDFRSNKIGIQNLPFVNGVSELFADTLSRLEFRDKATGNLMISQDRVSVTNLDFQELNTLTLTGNIEARRSGELSGNLELRVSERIMVGEDGSLKTRGFEGPKNGYYSMQVTLGGTVKEPVDDYREQLVAPVLKSAEEAPQTFEQLLNGL